MTELLRDIRHAFRLFHRTPVTVTVIIGSLTLAIGANTAVFSFVNAIQFKALPVADESTLVDVSEWSATELCAGCGVGTSYPGYIEWRVGTISFAAIEAYKEQSFVLSGVPEPERTNGALISPGLFRMIGAQPVRGRLLTTDDDRVGADPVVLVSDLLWHRLFAVTPDILGRTIKIDGVAHTVIGVMPPGFRFPEFAQLWIPLQPAATRWERTDRSLAVLARLKPRVSRDAARAEMRTIAAVQAQTHADTNKSWTARVTSFREDMTGETAVASMVFLTAVGFVLLIACANVANLLLVRAVERRREIAIRLALGATRWRIARLVWTESLVLAASGGILGMLAALWVSRWLVSSFQVEAPYWIQFGMDWRAPAFCGAVTVATALFCGLAPALQASKRDVRSTLQDAASNAGGQKGQRFRHSLVVLQLALALLLLAGAGLMIKTVVRTYRFDVGYDPTRVLVADITLSGPRYAPPGARRAVATALVETLERIPGVRAAVSRTVFFAGFGGQPRRVMIDGVGEAPAGASPGFYYAVTPGYFATLGIPILQGRGFNADDIGRVVIVNSAMAERIWGNRSPVGARIRFGPDAPWLDVIAVVSDAGGSPVGSAEHATFAYVPYAGHDGPASSIFVSSTGPASALPPELRAAVKHIDPDLPLEGLMTAAEMYAHWAAPARFVALLMSGLSAIAILLATMGTYAVMAYGVAQRTREIGIRLALGATTRDVRKLLVGAGLRLVAPGLVLGLLGAWLGTRALKGILAGTSPTDPGVFAAVAIALAGVGLAACWIPSRRAIRIDPTIALRTE
jgi:putative ABC transport system permease protein